MKDFGNLIIFVFLMLIALYLIGKFNLFGKDTPDDTPGQPSKNPTIPRDFLKELEKFDPRIPDDGFNPIAIGAWFHDLIFGPPDGAPIPGADVASYNASGEAEALNELIGTQGGNMVPSVQPFDPNNIRPW